MDAADVNVEKLSRLVEMGYEAENAAEVLSLKGNNFDLALEELLDNAPQTKGQGNGEKRAATKKVDANRADAKSSSKVDSGGGSDKSAASSSGGGGGGNSSGDSSSQGGSSNTSGGGGSSSGGAGGKGGKGDGNKGGRGGSGSGSSFPKGGRPGDWVCPRKDCADLVFGYRTACHLCGEPKPGYRATEPAPLGGKPGDWICPNPKCRDLVFARRNKCNKCGWPKPQQPVQAATGQTAASGGARLKSGSTAAQTQQTQPQTKAAAASRPGPTPASAEVQPGTGWNTIASKGKVQKQPEQVIPGMSVTAVDGDKRKRKRRRGKRGGVRRHGGEQDGEDAEDGDSVSSYVVHFERHNAYLEARRHNAFPVDAAEEEDVQQLQSNRSKVFAYVAPSRQVFGPFALSEVTKAAGSESTVLKVAPSGVDGVDSTVVEEAPARLLSADLTDKLLDNLAKESGSATQVSGAGASTGSGSRTGAEDEQLQTMMGEVSISGPGAATAPDQQDGKQTGVAGSWNVMDQQPVTVQQGMPGQVPAVSSDFTMLPSGAGFVGTPDFFQSATYPGDGSMPPGMIQAMPEQGGAYRMANPTNVGGLDLFGTSADAGQGNPIQLDLELGSIALGTGFGMSGSSGAGLTYEDQQQSMMMGSMPSAQSANFSQVAPDVIGPDIQGAKGSVSAVGGVPPDTSAAASTTTQASSSAPMPAAPEAPSHPAQGRSRTAALTPGEWNRVTVCHTEGTVFWVHEDVQSQTLAQMEIKMAQMYQGRPQQPLPPGVTLEPGAWFAAPYGDDTAEDVTWTRVEIQQIRADHVLVAHVDYGSMDTLAISRLRPLVPEFAKLPAQAIKCQLKNLPSTHPHDPTYAAKSQMFSMILNGHHLFASIDHFEQNGVCVVVLYNHNIQDMLPQIQATFASIPAISAPVPVMGPGVQQGFYEPHGRQQPQQRAGPPGTYATQPPQGAQWAQHQGQQNPWGHRSAKVTESVSGEHQQRAHLGPQAGFIFHCTSKTVSECLARGLFGLPGEYLKQMQGIKPEATVLFLYNVDEEILLGTFEATSEVGHEIEADAWVSIAQGGSKTTPLPAQVRVRRKHDFPAMKMRRCNIGFLTVEQVAELEQILAGNASR